MQSKLISRTIMNLKLHYRISLVLICLLMPLASVSCGSDEHEAGMDKDVFEVKGRYLSTDMRGESISVVHETVPDVMMAMRMSLRIDDASVAETLETGDIIQFDMVRTEDGWFARNIELLPPDTELDLPDHLREVGLPQ